MTEKITFLGESTGRGYSYGQVATPLQLFPFSVSNELRYVTATFRPDASGSIQDSGIQMTPGVCGGVARIAGTRVPVWVIVRARQLGATDEVLLCMYPSLGQADLAAAERYADLHHAEIDQQIQENETD